MDSQFESNNDSENSNDNLFSKVLNGMKSVFNNTGNPRKTFTKKTGLPKQAKTNNQSSLNVSHVINIDGPAQTLNEPEPTRSIAIETEMILNGNEVEINNSGLINESVNTSGTLMSEFLPSVLGNAVIIDSNIIPNSGQSSILTNASLCFPDPNIIVEVKDSIPHTGDLLIIPENFVDSCNIPITPYITNYPLIDSNVITPIDENLVKEVNLVPSTLFLGGPQINIQEGIVISGIHSNIDESYLDNDNIATDYNEKLQNDLSHSADLEDNIDPLPNKPRIVLKFRSEKSGLRSTNMKIVSDTEKYNEKVECNETTRRSSRGKAHADSQQADDSKKEKGKSSINLDESDMKSSNTTINESDDSPQSTRKKRSILSNPSDSNSEDSPSSNRDKNSLKRSARRRSREFSENVLANAIARKEKINNESTAHTRPSRRIKPTAKVLANRELRLGLETQNNARLGLVADKVVTPDEGKMTRSKLKKTPEKNKIEISPTKKSAEKKIKKCKIEPYANDEKSLTDDEKLNTTTDNKKIFADDSKQFAHDSPLHEKKIVQESKDDSDDGLAALHNLNKSKGKFNDDDKRINRLKKKHLRKLGLKAVTDQPKKMLSKEKDSVTDESTMDSTNTEAIIEHLNSRNIKSSAHQKIPEFSKGEETPLIPVKKIRNTKTVKRKLALSDSEDSMIPNKDSEESNDDVDIPVRITRKRSKMNNNSSDHNNDDEKRDTSGDSTSDANVISCFCVNKTNLYADPNSLAETEFCRAIEFIGGRTIGCGRPVTIAKLVRAGPRAPFILACDMHHYRLSLHQSCAGCGVFCTQGTCYQCSEGHLFHFECGLPFVSMYVSSGQLEQSMSPNHDQNPNQPRGTLTDLYNSEPGCPHCGLSSPSLEPINIKCFKVNLEMKCSTPMIFLPSPRLQWTPAFMSFSSSDKHRKDLEDIKIAEELSVLPCDLLKTLNDAIQKIISKRGNGIDYDDLLIENQDMNLIKAVCEKESTIENIVTAINSGADPRKHISLIDEGTFLHLAARELNLSALHIFRSLGCDLNDYDVEHRTPLMLAVMNYDTDIIEKEEINDKMEAIGEKRNDADTENVDDIITEDYVSPVTYSHGKSDKFDKELIEHQNEYRMVVDYLLKAGSDVTLKGPNGATILHLTAKYGDVLTCSQILRTHTNLAKSFINHKDDGGWTPLIWAVENKSCSVVRFLLDNGSDPTLKDSENNIALHWAASAGSSTILEYLLNFGSNVNAINLNGDTPLHLSARQNHYNCLIILLARGAQMDLKNSDGDTPLDCVNDENSDCYSALTINKQLQKIVNSNPSVERTVSVDISNGKEENPIRCVNSVDDENLDGQFTYITKNCLTVDINIDQKITSMQVCQCTGICGQSDNSCACVNLSMQCWYDSKGKLASNFDYKDPPMIFECSDACSCNKLQCYNRCLGRGAKVMLKVFRQVNTARGGGWGVCAAQFIEKGTLVCEYVGEILPGSLAYHRNDDSYLFELEMKDDILQDSIEPYCIDAKNYGNVSRLINHKCDPNIVPVRIFVDHQDLHFPRIAFFASSNIEYGEELGFDYGAKFWNIKIKSFTCNCNSKFCRYNKKDKNSVSDGEISEYDDMEQIETDN